MKKEKKSKGQILRETYEGQFGAYTVEQLDEEIRNALKFKMDKIAEKKETAGIFNEQIKDYDDLVQYCVERVDFLRHEAQVAHVLETNP